MPRIPWNKGKKGLQVWSKESRKKVSESLKKIRPHLSETHKKKISDAHKGKKKPWARSAKGRKISLEGRMNMSASRKGEKASNWRGGITPKNLIIRHSIEYVLWRKAVFERDKYTCIWCGDNRGGNLQADHIQEFALYPQLRFAIDNGRTLCKPCHKKRHHSTTGTN